MRVGLWGSATTILAWLYNLGFSKWLLEKNKVQLEFTIGKLALSIEGATFLAIIIFAVIGDLFRERFLPPTKSSTSTPSLKVISQSKDSSQASLEKPTSVLMKDDEGSRR